MNGKRLFAYLGLALLVVGPLGPFVVALFAVAQPPTVCPQEHTLREVPILVGQPNQDMATRLQRGEALLTGCTGNLAGYTGNPRQPETAYVCERCKQWKTAAMAYWQPLPKDFGTEKKQ